ncbi:TraR/DksA family transcriptional regulator [Geobacter pelophilus]|uniref:TraR/DksA family transcriptional regulator n=1 Tax=Geoanaerobacter pelophilus TaxID=60036 RepID=A0AAW4L867_9BACT|nr:TraR/DksA family transcriptional regulator [Geoanaerobacter pelophilus]
MPDDMDLCQQINQERIDDALADHYRRRVTGTSLTHCVDCGDPIPAKRQIYSPGCCRCVACQTDFENGFKG